MNIALLLQMAAEGGTQRTALVCDGRHCSYADLLGAARGASAAEREGEGIAAQIFTSGTTGAPKAALLRHANLLGYILATVEFGGAAETDAQLVCVPPYHIAGISELLSSIYAMRRIVLLPAFDPDKWLALAEAERVTNAFVVPTMLARILERLEAGAKADLSSLRAIAYGGGRMPRELIERALAMFPEADFTNAYGLTETSSTIALLGPREHRAALASTDPAVRARLGSVGGPCPPSKSRFATNRGVHCQPANRERSMSAASRCPANTGSARPWTIRAGFPPGMRGGSTRTAFCF